jgi:hypothetical protein
MVAALVGEDLASIRFEQGFFLLKDDVLAARLTIRVVH